MSTHLLKYLLLLVVALNPILWAHPVQALQAAGAQRLGQPFAVGRADAQGQRAEVAARPGGDDQCGGRAGHHVGSHEDEVVQLQRVEGLRVALMRELGLTAYRFSIAWNRVLPEGRFDWASLRSHEALRQEIEAIGVGLLDARSFLDDQLATDGAMTKGRLPIEPEHLAHGIQIARECARLDIGQGCVVRQGTVLAVEAYEGTDEMLRRAGFADAQHRQLSGGLTQLMVGTRR